MVSRQHEVPVQYGGRRFASTTAARWAVFFDTLGIRYEYRPEGVAPRAPGWYLPDFALPDFRVWVEVRAAGPLTSHTLRGPAAYARAFNTLVYVFAGALTPAAQWAARSPVICRPVIDERTGARSVMVIPDAAWTECPTCGRVAIPQVQLDAPLAPEIVRRLGVPPGTCAATLARCACPATRLLDRAEIRRYGTTPRLLAAYAAARAARFEC